MGMHVVGLDLRAGKRGLNFFFLKAGCFDDGTAVCCAIVVTSSHVDVDVEVDVNVVFFVCTIIGLLR